MSLSCEIGSVVSEIKRRDIILTPHTNCRSGNLGHSASGSSEELSVAAGDCERREDIESAELWMVSASPLALELEEPAGDADISSPVIVKPGTGSEGTVTTDETMSTIEVDNKEAPGHC